MSYEQIIVLEIWVQCEFRGDIYLETIPISDMPSINGGRIGTCLLIRCGKWIGIHGVPFQVGKSSCAEPLKLEFVLTIDYVLRDCRLA